MGLVSSFLLEIQIRCNNLEEKPPETPYFRDQCVRNGHLKAFISRFLRAYRWSTQTETPPRLSHALPYVKDSSEATECTAMGLGVGIAHRPKATMDSRIMQIKDQLNPKHPSEVSHHFVCLVITQVRISWLYDGGDELTQVTAYTFKTGHEFNFATVEIITHAGSKGKPRVDCSLGLGRELNRFIDLASAYIVVCGHLQAWVIDRWLESTLDLGLSSSTNPLTATKAALALAKVSSSVRSGRGTSHLNADVTKHFEERVRKLQSRKLLIKQAFELVSRSCSTYNVEEFEQLIPYKDSPADVQGELKADAAQEAGEDIAGLLREREELLMRLRDVDTELNRCRSAFNSAIWELNDLSAPVGD
ncbi:hypothetical protein SprV_0401625300 [Sparganum proliferum]